MHHLALKTVCAAALGSALAAQAPGLRIFQSIGPQTTQMVDTLGSIAHSWPGTANLIAHVGPDGTMWRGVQTGYFFQAGGETGRLQRLSFGGTVLWDFLLDGPDSWAHHDIEPMPNGNLLVIAWDQELEIEALNLGRRPSYSFGHYWRPDSILELQPTGFDTANIVWEWHLKDHLIQDFDPTKGNYGVVADHPELLDINYPPQPEPNGDWNHFNGLDYDPINDWIIVSSREQNEIYIIDHSTTTAEAAGHTGGFRGKGGDILYRWGNPEAYGAGTAANQQLFGQHDPRFVTDGYPGSGNVTLFNNDYQPLRSAAFELVLPQVNAANNFDVDPVTGRYGPLGPVWEFDMANFYSTFVSSVERLPNGNTLICSGLQNTLFEVTPTGQLDWFYVHPNSLIIFQASYVERTLWGVGDTLSIGGGQVGFEHLTGSAHYDDICLLLGSVSGTWPGTMVPGGITLPLNSDFLTDAMVTSYNSGIFIDTLRRLDTKGSSSSAINVGPGLIPAGLIGVNMDFAHLLFNNSLLPIQASNTTRVTIVP